MAETGRAGAGEVIRCDLQKRREKFMRAYSSELMNFPNFIPKWSIKQPAIENQPICQ